MYTMYWYKRLFSCVIMHLFSKIKKHLNMIIIKGFIHVSCLLSVVPFVILSVCLKQRCIRANYLAKLKTTH